MLADWPRAVARAATIPGCACHDPSPQLHATQQHPPDPPVRPDRRHLRQIELALGVFHPTGTTAVQIDGAGRPSAHSKCCGRSINCGAAVAPTRCSSRWPVTAPGRRPDGAIFSGTRRADLPVRRCRACTWTTLPTDITFGIGPAGTSRDLAVAMAVDAGAQRGAADCADAPGGGSRRSWSFLPGDLSRRWDPLRPLCDDALYDPDGL